jgi:glycosyltransferase involved in cell wall biosynthesis
MRVLLVSHGYPPLGVAGVERLTAQLAGELTARGHVVSVLTRQPGGQPPTVGVRHELRDGVPVTVAVGGGSTFGLFPGHEAALESVFERTLAEVSPDVVLITHLLNHSPGYVAIAQRWGIPVVLELHDFFMACPRAHLQRVSGELCGGPEGGRACATYCFSDQENAELRWSLRSHAFAAALAAADEVVAPSPFVAEAFEVIRGDERPIRIVENAVARMGPVLKSEPAPGAPLRLASIGVTVEHKGFRVVADAIRKSGIPRVSYTIFGVALPPLSFELLEMADKIPRLDLKLASGFEPGLLPVLLADTDATVVPSIVPETYSIVTRESFACGVPVIASRIGALPDAIRPGENGWLFEPGDSGALGALLTELNADRDRLRRASEGIRRDDWVTLDARTDQIEALLTEVIARGPRPAARDGGEIRLMREGLLRADAGA